MVLVNTVIRRDIKRSSYFIPPPSLSGTESRPRWCDSPSEALCRVLPTLESTQSSCHRLIPRAFITPGCSSVLAAKVTNEGLQLGEWGSVSGHTAGTVGRGFGLVFDNQTSTLFEAYGAPDVSPQCTFHNWDHPLIYFFYVLQTRPLWNLDSASNHCVGVRPAVIRFPVYKP